MCDTFIDLSNMWHATGLEGDGVCVCASVQREDLGERLPSAKGSHLQIRSEDWIACSVERVRVLWGRADLSSSQEACHFYISCCGGTDDHQPRMLWRFELGEIVLPSPRIFWRFEFRRACGLP